MAAGRDKSSSRTTIFHQLLNPNVTEGHVVPSVDDLKDEAYIIVAAAADTTGNAMTIAAYNVISNDTIYHTLAAELKETFPDPDARLDLPCSKRSISSKCMHSQASVVCSATSVPRIGVQASSSTSQLNLLDDCHLAHSTQGDMALREYKFELGTKFRNV